MDKPFLKCERSPLDIHEFVIELSPDRAEYCPRIGCRVVASWSCARCYKQICTNCRTRYFDFVITEEKTPRRSNPYKVEGISLDTAVWYRDTLRVALRTELVGDPYGIELINSDEDEIPPLPSDESSSDSDDSVARLTKTVAQLRTDMLRMNAQQQTLDVLMNQLPTEDMSCIVCMDHPRSVALLPCGHRHFCMTCAEQLSHCASCRSPVVERVQIFL